MANKLRQSSSYKYWCRFEYNWESLGLQREEGSSHGDGKVTYTPSVVLSEGHFVAALGAALNPD